MPPHGIPKKYKREFMENFITVTDTITVCKSHISAIEKGMGDFAFKIYLRGGGEPLRIDKCLPEAEVELLAFFSEGEEPMVMPEAPRKNSPY